MGAKEFARLKKSLTKAGVWRCGATDPKNGKMGKDAFPLAKGRSYILGNQFRWRVDHWESGSARGRLLIAYHLGKQNYLAFLSVERGPKEYAIILCLEYHADHPGWHVHTGTGPIREFAVGCARQRIFGIRIPRKGRYHRLGRGYEMSPIVAQNIAYKAFRIVDATATEDLFL